MNIIEVKDFYKGIPVIEFIGRYGNVVDHYGEKLYESHISNVLTKIFSKYDMSPSFFMLLWDVVAPKRSKAP